jgi:hypothetical protein
LSTTNSMWTDPGMNPGLHDERLATNCLSHGTAEYIWHDVRSLTWCSCWDLPWWPWLLHWKPSELQTHCTVFRHWSLWYYGYCL